MQELKNSIYLFYDSLHAIDFLIENGMLRNQKKCVCGGTIQLRRNDNPSVFRCTKKVCRKGLCLFENTIFKGIKKEINTILKFIYFFC